MVREFEYKERRAVAYVDGSYNKETKTYGSGVVFINADGEINELSFSGNDPEMAKMYQVGGEINAARRAIEEAVKGGYDSITIFYDYAGIEQWANGAWRTNNRFTYDYAKFVNEKRLVFNIDFVKVKGHSNDMYNDLADSLAKRGCGVS